jgi:hypothetical protein
MRGSLRGVDKFPACECGELCDIAGNPPAAIEPKVMLPGALLFGATGPPFGV